jgi:hypothetical protein
MAITKATEVKAVSETPPWDRLAGAAYRAARHGDWKQAAELGFAARQAWLSHCESVHAQEQARRRIPVRSVWTRDEERER